MSGFVAFYSHSPDKRAGLAYVCNNDFEKGILQIRKILLCMFNIPEERIEIGTERPTSTKRKEICSIIVLKIKEYCVFKNYFCGTKIFHPECFNECKKNGLLADDVTFFSKFLMTNKNYGESDVFFPRSQSIEENLTDCSKTLNFIVSF